MYSDENTKRFIAELHRLTGLPDNLIEKDVWQTFILRHLCSDKILKNKLIFKGGTCLIRTLLGYYRFSEDLDFAWKDGQKRGFYRKFEREFLTKLETIGVRVGKHYGTRGGKLMKWDLLCGAGGDIIIVLSVNFSEEIIFPVVRRKLKTLKVVSRERKKLYALFRDITQAYYSKLQLRCYSAEEIACEKFAAVLTRRDLRKPRDLIDLFELQKIVNLSALSKNKKVAGKIHRSVMSSPAYVGIFKQRKRDIPTYLDRLEEESKTESEIYIKMPDRAELMRFLVYVLKPIFKKLCRKI
ncbi:MAG: nucleotidyl transferase AbiEii/AbiGii toxin family protein [Candidatus Micrarchaeota archaeon]